MKILVVLGVELVMVLLLYVLATLFPNWGLMIFLCIVVGVAVAVMLETNSTLADMEKRLKALEAKNSDAADAEKKSEE